MATLTVEQAFQLAIAHHQAGRLPEADAIYRQILAVDPCHADALHHLGIIAHQAGRNNVAVDLITKAITLKPKFPEAYNNLGIALKESGRKDEAITAFHQAIVLVPNFAQAHNNLGNALKDIGQLDRAISAYRQAIALRHNDPEAHSNLGNALKDIGRLDEAVVAYRNAIALMPAYTEAHSYLALALLVRGNFKEGWEEYEWRWKMKDVARLGHHYPQPQWDGTHLAGCTVLLHAEQGFGDALQFIRYLPMLKERGGKIIIECQPELHRLLQTNISGSPILDRGQTLPPFDLHCPLLSLPRIFSADLTNIPRNVPYLHANAAEVLEWQDRLTPYSSVAKVGLVWAGSPDHKNDRNRSLKLANFAPLFEASGMEFFSLQKGEMASKANILHEDIELTDLGKELSDFADTAALIANLDLVITVDTAVAHLAGAMGRPVWVLLPFAPDWRWLLDREDSPWYPTMRLFRQPAIGDWESVIRRVARELADFRG